MTLLKVGRDVFTDVDLRNSGDLRLQALESTSGSKKKIKLVSIIIMHTLPDFLMNLLDR